MDRRAKRRLGIAMVVAGILGIVVTVIWVLEVANGPGQPRTFAERRSYNQTKVAIHEVFPTAMAFALLGLGVAWGGSRLIERASEDAEEREGEA